MNITLLNYDGFSEFETVIMALLFKQHNLIAVSLENREYRSEENQRYCYDQLVSDVDVDSIDLLVIPGGDPAQLVGNQILKHFVEQMLARNKKVAGICGGAAALAGQGFLKGKKCTGLASGVQPGSGYDSCFAGSILTDQHVVVDGNIITAQGQAYVEFAVELARQMGLYAEPETYEADIKWFKNIR
jgi:putative intracellular protease/amidase